MKDLSQLPPPPRPCDLLEGCSGAVVDRHFLVTKTTVSKHPDGTPGDVLVQMYELNGKKKQSVWKRWWSDMWMTFTVVSYDEDP